MSFFPAQPNTPLTDLTMQMRVVGFFFLQQDKPKAQHLSCAVFLSCAIHYIMLSVYSLCPHLFPLFFGASSSCFCLKWKLLFVISCRSKLHRINTSVTAASFAKLTPINRTAALYIKALPKVLPAWKATWGRKRSINTVDEASFTFQQVRAKAGGTLDGGAVPPHVCEGLLADGLGLASSPDDAVHDLQVPAAHLELVGHQPGEQPAVVAFIPGHPAAALRQPAAGRGWVSARGDHRHPSGDPAGEGEPQKGARGCVWGSISPGIATHSHWMAAESPSWQSSAAAAVGRPMAGDGAGADRRRRPLLSPQAARSSPPPPGRGTTAVSVPFTAG